MANLDQNERNEALSMLITIGLSHYQQNYGNASVDMNSLKRLHGKIVFFLVILLNYVYLFHQLLKIILFPVLLQSP